MAEPFHEGEIAIQKRTEEHGIAMLNGNLVADNIPPGAVPFISQQYYALFSSHDSDGNIWISMLTGEPGFAKSAADRKSIDMALPDAAVRKDDPVFGQLSEGQPVGGLFIELSTRRRLRANGKAVNVDDSQFTLAIDQAYPNCPKYIQQRNVEGISGSNGGFSAGSGEALTDEQKALIANADTLFLGSADANNNFDASQRGGKPGFVGIDGNTLRIPDYPGNSMYNSFGNFEVNNKGGMTFVDFENNVQLHLTGEVTLEFGVEADKEKTGGTGRWWQFKVTGWCTSPLAYNLGWKFVSYSPFIPKD